MRVRATRSALWRDVALMGMAAFLLPSCSIIGLRTHVETMEAHGMVAVRVSPRPSKSTPTDAVAWTHAAGKPVHSVGFQRVRPDGYAWFSLRTDRPFNVGAFIDENGNRAYDAGEPAAYVSDVKALSLGDPDVQRKVVQLTLRRENGVRRGTTIPIPEENKELGSHIHIVLGEVVSLDDKRLTTDTGGSGLWRPFDFLSTNRMGIYFLEPYDSKRIPVLLVNGIGGTPQDFRYLIDHFDRKRYQIWILHYPSGARLERVARSVAAGLNILRQRDGFSQCDVVAHSMGGLVARVAIDEAVSSSGVDFIPKFVSISTPWGGHSAASAGIRHLKKPVPSWIDVAPNSKFLAEIYATRLPPGTRHLLIYGSKEGGPFWVKGENDGVVTVESETDPRIKKAASSVVHFPYGHVEILEQHQTLEKVLQFLGSETND